jgi:hypothetical protein
VKRILAIISAVLISSHASAADLKLKCRGGLGKITGWQGEGAEKRPLVHFINIEFDLSISDREITFEADPKYDLGGTPVRSVLTLPFKNTDNTISKFESVERSKRPGQEARGRIVGYFSKTGAAHIYWRDDERGLSGKCEFQVGTRSTTSAKVT